jgi:transposase InsO family protein
VYGENAWVTSLSWESQLDRLIKEYDAFFNEARPHRAIEQRIPVGARQKGRTKKKDNRVLG